MSGDQALPVAEQLRSLTASALREADRDRAARMLADHARPRLMAANRQWNEEFRRIRSRADWERFRDAKLSALRRSLGHLPAAEEPHVRVNCVVPGDGFRIENLVIASLPGSPIPANLYLPDPPRPRMPGIIICHSHHRPKTQGELQDMGMTWARLGTMVLVPDMIGQGERRQHPFTEDCGLPNAHRQDYHSRYFLGMQMHVAGESLIGWMVRDLIRCVDVLLGREGVDPQAIILIGAVAGGGDPAAVAAALDSRIACAVPFNFGGPQPESPYPLPEDAETEFNYAGWGSWESTRNLLHSARDGFLPWVIVGAIAPRPLVYAHEFSWDRDRDPVWPRLKRIYDFFGAEDRLAFAHGHGVLQGRPPAASHCTNVGPVHRAMLYPVLQRWFALPAPQNEHQQRRAPEELLCLAGSSSDRQAADSASPMKSCHQLLAERAARQVAACRQRLEPREPATRRRTLRNDWRRVLGNVEPGNAEVVSRQAGPVSSLLVERLVLQVEPDILLPVVLIRARRLADARIPVVVGLAQQGKSAFLANRAAEIAGLLEQRLALCLPDLRGTGETDPGGSRGPESPATEVSSVELMLGQTLVGGRLRDLRSLLGYLRTRKDTAQVGFGLWGDSFAATNPPGFVDPPAGPEAVTGVPADRQPAIAEPLGAVLALLGGLFEDDVAAVLARGGLVSFASLLDAPFCHVPHDIIIPEVLTVGDLADVVASLAPKPACLEAFVDGRNILVEQAKLDRWFSPARRAYEAVPDRLVLSAETAAPARWLAAVLQEMS